MGSVAFKQGAVSVLSGVVSVAGYTLLVWLCIAHQTSAALVSKGRAAPPPPSRCPATVALQDIHTRVAVAAPWGGTRAVTMT